MASGAVWGIDIGQCALKAMRCRLEPNSDRIVAEAFDYIEYPKILSQPGSDPAELVGNALKQFLSRNTVAGDRVAISVGGQAGLTRFIKLPPVEAKKIPDIVRYEARQQIPFDLNDVIWDYQRMGGGSEEEGFALEAEIGLFAMKRDAIFRALEPLRKVDIEVDIVQLMPLVLYNFVLFDQLPALPPIDEYDLDEPPESVVILSLGTDSTDLVITNGYRVWQRNIPLGGSHFTKALTKELKLTFAKAEHLKRNATTAADPKAVFQAMRPIFNELLTELQRSISYFCNLDRTAKIGRVIALGNAMKLPGLRRYLSQSLGYEIDRMESFHKLTGSQVIAAPAFEENLLSFGVCYGLAIQALGKSGVHTNLLPKEIVHERLIKRKKPWAIVSVAALLLGCAISYATHSLALGTVTRGDWAPAQQKAKDVAQNAQKLEAEYKEAETQFTNIDEIGKHLVQNVEKRICWLELLRAVTECLPRDDPNKPRPKQIALREELHVTNMECQWVDDVNMWREAVKAKGWDRETEEAAPPATGENADASAGSETASGAPTSGPLRSQESDAAGSAGAGDAAAIDPSLGGWIISLSGFHYHSSQADPERQGRQYVWKTLIKNLREKSITIPGSDGKPEEVSMSDLGISFPVLVDPKSTYERELVNPNIEPASPLAVPTATAAKPAEPDPEVSQRVKQFDFRVDFIWQPKTPSERHANKKTQEEKPSEQASSQQ